MDRSRKIRSLGADPNPSNSRQPTSTSTINALQRPELGERHYSAPSVARRRQSDAKRISESSKASDRTKRSSKASSRDDPAFRSSTNLGDSQIAERQSRSSFSVRSSIKSIDREELSLLTFAVVGNANVGKTTFIRNALDLRQPSVTSAAASKVSLGGALFRLQLLEVPCDTIDFVHGKILWPSTLELGASSHIDGVLCLYDVSNRDSVDGLPQILTALNVARTATCLVSCKVDIPLCDHEVGSVFLDKVHTKFPNFVHEQSSIESSDSAKRCLLKALRSALDTQESCLPGRSRPDPNAAAAYPPRTSSRNPSTSSSRSRSSSRHQIMHAKSRENLLTAPPPPVIESEEEDSEESSGDDTEQPHKSLPKTPLRVNTTDIQSRPRNTQPQTPISTTEAYGNRLATPSTRPHPGVPETPESFSAAAVSRRDSADTTDGACRTFLDMDDESIHEDLNPSDEAAEGLRRLTTSDEASSEGVTFNELVDRLLAMPTSKGDQKFVPTFLCLYRAFATPLRLLAAIIDCFMRTEASDLVAFTKAAELLRYLSVLGLWTTYYPGDFANGTVREMATTFVTTIEKTKNFAPSARQIANNLQTYVADDDEDWAFTDATRPVGSRSNTASQKTSSNTTPSKSATARQRVAKKAKGDEDSDSDDGAPIPSSPRHSAATSSASSLMKGSQVSSQTSDNLHNLETARENARRLRTIPHIPVSKTQWHQFMGYSTEELALEITRIDWTMYSAIRPRDFVRYVTISNSQRARPGHIDYIGMMAKHFNHLALFTSGMILLRDKPKHRAKILEKFMDLAWKVRQMNNYHALGAIVAALNSEEIVRLTQTQELISQEHHKQLLRLKILMGHQKSHAAYRMAWDNSSQERIPFLPRIQEDLTKAAMGNATFAGGGINWSKFEVMGETVVSVQRSQEQPYNFPDRTARGHEIDQMILETRVLEGDEDCADPQQELYERSKMVEPLTSGMQSKKFDWLTGRR